MLCYVSDKYTKSYYKPFNNMLNVLYIYKICTLCIILLWVSFVKNVSLCFI